MLTAATNTTLEVAQGKLWFGTYAMENFRNLISSTSLWGSMRNSFVYATVQTILALFVCSLAGYGFELYHDKGKDVLFAILLMAMMIPGVATMIPLFTMMSKMILLANHRPFHFTQQVHAKSTLLPNLFRKFLNIH